MAISGEWDAEDIERRFPRSFLEHEGTTGVMHMLADALEMWADSEGCAGVIRDAADKLRELAGPLHISEKA